MFDHKAFADEYRIHKGKLPTSEWVILQKCIAAGLGQPQSPLPPSVEVRNIPTWLTLARSLIGTKEIPGPRHNPIILGWWKLIGIPMGNDETPYCGTFVGYLMKVSGLAVVKNPAWARNWTQYGSKCGRIAGAVAVFSRAGGGGHVGLLVGVSGDGRMVYVLGANQRNEVNIMPLEARRLLDLRWPPGVPIGTHLAPVMSGGVVSTREA